MYEFIELDTDGEIALVTLNRPQKLNAWHKPMRDELGDCITALGTTDSVRAVVLTGAGDKAFSAGQDLAETQQFASGEHGRDWSKSWHDFYATLRACEKPLVAAVNGVAAGSGFQVALFADIRVGHVGTEMGQPEINAGIPSTMGPWVMYERLGLSRTVELTLTGRMMDGTECHRVGLIHHLVPASEVLDKAKEVAHHLAGKPAVAIRLNKRRFREITQAAFDDACAAGQRIQAEAFASGEPQAAMAAFFAERAKRKPRAKTGN